MLALACSLFYNTSAQSGAFVHISIYRWDWCSGQAKHFLGSCKSTQIEVHLEKNMISSSVTASWPVHRRCSSMFSRSYSTHLYKSQLVLLLHVSWHVIFRNVFYRLLNSFKSEVSFSLHVLLGNDVSPIISTKSTLYSLSAFVCLATRSHQT